MARRPPVVSRHRQSITPSTRFKQLPVWLLKADVVAYFRLGRTDAQAIFDAAERRCLIDGVEKISKYQLQTPPYPDLIRVMQRHPSPSSIRRVFHAAIEKILADPNHPQYRTFKVEFCEVCARGAMSTRRTIDGALLDVKAASQFLE